MCDRMVPLACTTRVLVLQHPQEADHLLGTVPLLEGSLPVTMRVGLSWSSLTTALGETVDPGRWGVLFPDREHVGIIDRKGEPVKRRLQGIVVLDGTWTQAKTLWWRNAWLLKLARVSLRPTAPSIYGRLRREPSPTHTSTLEAVALAFEAIREPPETSEGLRRLMRTLAQRIRDAKRAEVGQ